MVQRFSFIKTIILFFAFVKIFVFGVFAEGVIGVNHYSSADGLSDNKITTIVKDREGFMWFATWAGINRFDGNRFIAFKSNPGDFSSLKNNRIDEIFEDPNSSFLWVKAYDNRIYRFDKRKHIFTSLHDLIKEEQFKKHQFIKILAIYQGQVWLKTIRGSVIVIDDAASSYPTFSELDELNDKSKTTYFFYLNKRGYAWVSNEKGLFLIKQTDNCKYSIKKYKEYQPNNPVKIITEDNRDGTIWLTYTKERIIKVDSFFREKANVKVTNGLIYDIKVSKDGEKVFCTSSEGELISLDKNGNKLWSKKTDDGAALYCIYEDEQKRLWLESEHYGVMRMANNNEKLIGLYPKNKYKFKPWVKNCTFFEDVNKKLWVSIRGYKLSAYDNEKEKLTEFALNIEGLNRNFSRIIQGVFYDPSGILWIITDNGGLDRVTLQGNLFHQSYIKDNQINKLENEVRGLLADKKNRLWVGTKSGRIILNENGKIKLDPLGINFKPEGGIYTIFQDKEGLFWIGTKGAGVYLVEEKEDEFKIIAHFLNQDEDKKNHRSEVYSILQDKKGRVWVATFGGGLVLIERDREKYNIFNCQNKFTNYPLDNYGKLRYLCTDSLGNLWIATSEGLVLYNPDDKTKEDTFKVYKKELGDIKSLGGNDIQFIYRDSKSQMWILTSSGGLNKAIGDKPLDTLKFKNYSKRQGFSSDFLLGCTEDSQQNLWISTRNGISKFSLLNQKVQNYSYYDGLHETIFSEGSVAKLSDDRIFFGNILGYLSFSAKDLNLRKEKGNLVFSNFQINSEDAILGDKLPLKSDINYLSKLILEHNQNMIGIEFSMLESSSASRHNFVYRLVSYDDIWRNSEGQSKILYSNLPPGLYTFQVKSMNGDLFTGISDRSLVIKILPPFWKSWWAYSIYTLLVVSFLIFIKRIATTILTLKQGIAVEKRLAEVKLNFFTQISHELRTPLTLIVNPIEEILGHETLSKKGKVYAKVIADNSKRMVRLINQILDLRKVNSGKAKLKFQQLDLITFVYSICGYFENYLLSKEIKIVLQTEYKELIVSIDQDKTETILYNVLANAIKFSPENSEIKVVIKLNQSQNIFSVEVIDKGPGVSNLELKKIFQLYYEGEAAANLNTKGTGIGLALSKELAELQKGKIYAENDSAGGLRVMLELPYQSNEYLPQSNSEIFIYNGEQKEDNLPFFKESVGDEERKIILIVEDNIDLRLFLNNKFEEFYKIELAINGEEGLKKAISLLPDLILSDIMMPKMDGIQMLNKIKNNSLTSHIPVVLLTAKHNVESHIQSLKYGADYYLPKPLNIELLFSAINNILVQRERFFHAIIEEKKHVSGIKELRDNPIITELDRKFLEQAIKIVDENIENPNFNIDAVADLIGMSRSSFFKKFKALTNMAPIDFLKNTRLEKAKALFNEGHNNISTVAYKVGFNNPKYFSTCFKTQYAITPKEYVKKCSSNFSTSK